MSPRFRRSLCASFLILAVLFPSQSSFACGPFSLEAVFSFAVHPEFPLEKFAAGEIGVLQPTFARSYLVAAYRSLAGNGFNATEQKALVALWQERLNYNLPDFDGAWPKPWLAARQTVSGVAAAPQISIYRHREKPNEYETYVNCQEDAFEKAAVTLSDRIKKFGADSPVIKDWVAAQDTVFANCSEGQHIPVALPGGADPLSRADRAYQVAAANFYAGNFDEATRVFETIARDNTSPWQQTAAYLSARTLLRKASLGPEERKAASLGQAEDVLKKLLNDRSLDSMHPAAGKLLSLVRLRAHPEARLHELAQTLMKRNDETLKQDLWDYTVLLDGFVGDDDSEQKKEVPVSLRKDDLTDWIVTIQAGGQAGGEVSLNHAVERWRVTASTPWLVAALTKVHSGHPQAGALISSAEKIGPDSPAFASVAFHQIRLAIESREFDQARAKLDDFLAKDRTRLPASSLNLFLSERMRLATNLTELLTYAQRVPAGFSWNEDDRELPADLTDDPDQNKALSGKTLFDVDGARMLNEKVPLTVLQEATESKVLPERLRRDVVQATWLRAVLLDDNRISRELAPTLKTLVPAMGPFLDDYLSPQPDEARKFSGIYTWLKFPGLQPVVNSGIGRGSQLDKQDPYRDNWWCSAAISPAPDKDKGSATAVTSNQDMQFPAFLTEAQKTTARTQFARLASFGAAPNYLCRQVIAFVEKHPTDPRAPEALHLAVKTTRYGCTDKETARWSKAAYDVLHQRFPKSPWTKKTPYWFKD